MAGEAEQQLRAYVEYLRDMGIHDFYRQGEPVYAETVSVSEAEVAARIPDIAASTPMAVVAAEMVLGLKAAVEEPKPVAAAARRPDFLEIPIPTLVSFDELAPLPGLIASLNSCR